MSKRLQVLLDEREFDELRGAARREGIPVSDWVRRALRDAHRRTPRRDVDAKLRALRRALGHTGPTGDIEQVLADIGSGYTASGSE